MSPQERRRAVVSSFLGSTVEYYDFLLYAPAGLVFPKLFFGNPSMVWPAFVLMVGIVQPAQFGPIGAFISEKFDPEYRYTGAGATFQFASILGAGLAPIVATELVKPGGMNLFGLGPLTNLATYGTCLFAVSTLAVVLSKETRRKMSHAQRLQMEGLFEA
ncbi:hypothetical protein GCM10027418_18500 [Mariniluteicoccus endophyticus]